MPVAAPSAGRRSKTGSCPSSAKSVPPVAPAPILEPRSHPHRTTRTSAICHWRRRLRRRCGCPRSSSRTSASNLRSRHRRPNRRRRRRPGIVSQGAAGKGCPEGEALAVRRAGARVGGADCHDRRSVEPVDADCRSARPDVEDEVIADRIELASEDATLAPPREPIVPAAVPPVAKEAPVPVRFAAEQSFSADSYGVDADGRETPERPRVRRSCRSRSRSLSGCCWDSWPATSWAVARPPASVATVHRRGRRASALRPVRGQPVGASVAGSRGPPADTARESADASAAPPTVPEETPSSAKPSAQRRSPASHAAAPVPVATSGRIVVRSTPRQGRGSLNGRWRGRTPLTLDRLPFRHYVVRVVQPGYRADESEFALSAKDSARTINARLSREPARRPAAGFDGREGRAAAGHDAVDSPACSSSIRDRRGRTCCSTDISSARHHCGFPTLELAVTSSASSLRNIRPLRPPRGSPPDRRAASRDLSSEFNESYSRSGKRRCGSKGKLRARPAKTGGEVVFNTSMTGYQEVLTDPSYAGQIVTMTCAGDRQLRRRAPEDVESRGAASGRLHHPRRVADRQQLARRRHAARLPRRATTSSRSPTSTRAR